MEISKYLRCCIRFQDSALLKDVCVCVINQIFYLIQIKENSL